MRQRAGHLTFRLDGVRPGRLRIAGAGRWRVAEALPGGPALVMRRVSGESAASCRGAAAGVLVGVQICHKGGSCIVEGARDPRNSNDLQRAAWYRTSPLWQIWTRPRSNESCYVSAAPRVPPAGSPSLSSLASPPRRCPSALVAPSPPRPRSSSPSAKEPGEKTSMEEPGSQCVDEGRDRRARDHCPSPSAQTDGDVDRLDHRRGHQNQSHGHGIAGGGE